MTDTRSGWCLGWLRPPHYTDAIHEWREGLDLCTDCLLRAQRQAVP